MADTTQDWKDHSYKRRPTPGVVTEQILADAEQLQEDEATESQIVEEEVRAEKVVEKDTKKLEEDLSPVS